MLLKGLRKKNKSINEITEHVTKVFHANCKSLNCLTPTKEPKATDHIIEMVKTYNKAIAPLLDLPEDPTRDAGVNDFISSHRDEHKSLNQEVKSLKLRVQSPLFSCFRLEHPFVIHLYPKHQRLHHPVYLPF